MSSIGISFNFLTSYCTYFNESLFYLDPSKVLKFCIENLSRFVILDHCYPLYEYTVTVFSKDYIREKIITTLPERNNPLSY